jgi:hypothetical protein
MRPSLANKERWLCGIQPREQRRDATAHLRQLVSVDRSRYSEATRWASQAFAATADHYYDLALDSDDVSGTNRAAPGLRPDQQVLHLRCAIIALHRVQAVDPR